MEAATLSACRIHGTTPPPSFSANLVEDLGSELGAGLLEDVLCRGKHSWHNCPEVHKAIDGVRFIADHTKREEDSTRVSIHVWGCKTFYCRILVNHRSSSRCDNLLRKLNRLPRNLYYIFHNSIFSLCVHSRSIDNKVRVKITIIAINSNL